MEKFRQTGRTTKMIEKALASQLDGYNVVVVSCYSFNNMVFRSDHRVHKKIKIIKYNSRDID